MLFLWYKSSENFSRYFKVSLCLLIHCRSSAHLCSSDFEGSDLKAWGNSLCNTFNCAPKKQITMQKKQSDTATLITTTAKAIFWNWQSKKLLGWVSWENGYQAYDGSRGLPKRKILNWKQNCFRKMFCCLTVKPLNGKDLTKSYRSSQLDSSFC